MGDASPLDPSVRCFAGSARRALTPTGTSREVERQHSILTFERRGEINPAIMHHGNGSAFSREFHSPSDFIRRPSLWILSKGGAAICVWAAPTERVVPGLSGSNDLGGREQGN